MTFPTTRPRRLRMNEPIRKMVRETRLAPEQFVLPLFVCPGTGIKKEISSMPGNYNWSVDLLVEEVRSAKSLGIGGVMLFGIPEKKDDLASGAYDDNGIVQQALRALKREVPGILLITDVCLCEYTANGHCGLVSGDEILNDESLDLLARTALSQAKAGADIIAPSDMMDGRVRAIRKLLDENSFQNITDSLLRCEICLWILRTIPRSGGIGSGFRRPAQSPDGPRECPRSFERGGA